MDFGALDELLAFKKNLSLSKGVKGLYIKIMYKKLRGD